MARCFVTRRLPFPALDRLSAVHDVDIWPERLPPRYEELVARAADAEALLADAAARFPEPAPASATAGG